MKTKIRVKIVPQKDWEIIQKYITSNEFTAIIPQNIAEENYVDPKDDNTVIEYNLYGDQPDAFVEIVDRTDHQIFDWGI